jgi:hypothetical protein
MFQTVMQRKPIWYKRGTEYLKPPPGHEPVSSHVVTAKLLWGFVNINIVYGYFQTKSLHAERVADRGSCCRFWCYKRLKARYWWRWFSEIYVDIFFYKKYVYSFIYSFFIYIDLFIYFLLLVYDIFMYIYQNWRPVNRFGEFKSKFKRFSV